VVHSTDGVSGYHGEEGDRNLSGATDNPTTVAPFIFSFRSFHFSLKRIAQLLFQGIGTHDAQNSCKKRERFLLIRFGLSLFLCFCVFFELLVFSDAGF